MALAREATGWKGRIEHWRHQKDSFFKRNPHSPLARPARKKFAGLTYFPPDPAWAVRAAARRVDEGEPIEVAMTRGGPREYVRYARATFSTPGGAKAEVTLFHQPHEHVGHEPHELFLPFRDATSGKTTYGAGRYLEVPNPFGPDDATAEVLIDFNYAYCPFCAYNEEYACPLPPRENWFDFPVEAGETFSAE